MFKKLKKGLLAGTIFSTAANMHACVYGPPPSSYDAESNENAVLYGPPEEIQTYDDSDSSKESTTTTTKQQDSYDPKDNQNEDVYGIWRSTDSGESWQRINDDMHQFGAIGESMAADLRTFGQVYFGSNGRGILMGKPLK